MKLKCIGVHRLKSDHGLGIEAKLYNVENNFIEIDVNNVEMLNIGYCVSASYFAKLDGDNLGLRVEFYKN